MPEQHHHSEHHAHHHHHLPARFDRAFAIGIGLNLVFVIVEFTVGVLVGSLALVADAGHNLSDVLGLVMAWGATLLARRPSTARRTYGMRRATILAALANAALLFIAIGGIAWEAGQRLFALAEVPGMTLIAVASVGVAINTFTAWLFARGRANDLNIRGAFLHMAADAVISLGVIVAGALILLTGWSWIDPLLSLVIVAVIGWGAWDLARESIDLALDAVPATVDLLAVRAFLTDLPSVREVHDLHIWALSTTEPALTTHLVLTTLEGCDALLAQVRAELHQRFGIEHVTVQLEQGDPRYPCGACREGL
jgi:cobalt-zinc-cadmium efflux system protein